MEGDAAAKVCNCNRSAPIANISFILAAVAKRPEPGIPEFTERDFLGR